ncbi:MAG TPA: hypothetical protein VJI67_03100 [archaeon]|nr:hypothetical protein [archaeon]
MKFAAVQGVLMFLLFLAPNAASSSHGSGGGDSGSVSSCKIAEWKDVECAGFCPNFTCKRGEMCQTALDDCNVTRFQCVRSQKCAPLTTPPTSPTPAIEPSPSSAVNGCSSGDSPESHADCMPEKPQPNPSSESLCASGNGAWREFPQACADSCFLAENPERADCVALLTSSCDCGLEKCWNGSECVSNPVVKVVSDGSQAINRVVTDTDLPLTEARPLSARLFGFLESLFKYFYSFLGLK